MTNTTVPLVFFRDHNAESQSAAAALAETNLEIQEIFIKDPVRDEKPVPRLLAPEGYFDTLDSILWYARVYGNNT